MQHVEANGGYNGDHNGDHNGAAMRRMVPNAPHMGHCAHPQTMLLLIPGHLIPTPPTQQHRHHTTGECK